VRRCTICGEVKPIEEFVVDRSMASGRRNQCRACRAAVVRDRRRRSPEKLREENLRRRDAKREWEADQRAECPRCGEPMGAGSGLPSHRPKGVCASCIKELAREKVLRWQAMRRRGMNNVAIAAAEGVECQAVAQALQRSNCARVGVGFVAIENDGRSER
jgi:hypothetical protein